MAFAANLGDNNTLQIYNYPVMVEGK